MKVSVLKNKFELGKEAAKYGAKLINKAISEQGRANIIVATGASQFEMLEQLVIEEIDWSVVVCFHLDEYIGLSKTHPASFRKYLKERFVDRVNPKAFHYVNGEGDVQDECDRLENLIHENPIDVAFVGIGENAHLAFNDPPADFTTELAYIDVALDLACREQQLGEGWFENIDEVPERAISMSIHQIMKSKHIVCSVPDKRKAMAVTNVVNGTVTPDIPASILQEHSDTHMFLDEQSSSLLKKS